MGLLKETTFSLEEGAMTEQRIDRSAVATDNPQLLFIFDLASQGHTNHREEKGQGRRGVLTQNGCDHL